MQAQDGGQEVTGSIVGGACGGIVDWGDRAGDGGCWLAGGRVAQKLATCWSGHRIWVDIRSWLGSLIDSFPQWLQQRLDIGSICG